jgi:hypothetical protein
MKVEYIKPMSRCPAYIKWMAMHIREIDNMPAVVSYIEDFRFKRRNKWVSGESIPIDVSEDTINIFGLGSYRTHYLAIHK